MIDMVITIPGIQNIHNYRLTNNLIIVTKLL